LLSDDRDNRIRPTRGQSLGVSQDFAGLGGSVKYIKTRINADKYWKPFGNFVFGLSFESGYIHPLENRGLAGIDDVRLTDRFYLGEPQMRGFDIRGVGPRVQRIFQEGKIVNGVAVNNPITDRNQIQDDAIGGRFYYMGRAELQIPLGSGAKELGLRPSLFVDVGSVFDVTRPVLQSVQQREVLADGTQGGLLYYFVDSAGALQTSTTAVNGDGSARVAAFRFKEEFLGDTWKPRLSVGFGVNWNSPFGPFRIDIARALLKQPGDDTKLFTFNVGTQF
jgi:outer membrane protein insertion porin family